jgi:hypothetical protein
LIEPDDSYHIYKWFDSTPAREKIERFLADHIVCRYDIPVYLLTMVSFFVRRTGLEFPRVINRHYTCWEFVYEFACTMGKPFEDEYQYPMITDFLERMGELPALQRDK